MLHRMQIARTPKQEAQRERTIQALKAAEIAPELRLLTRTEVSECIGLSLKSLDGMVRRGEIKPLRIGGKVLFKRSAVEAFLSDSSS